MLSTVEIILLILLIAIIAMLVLIVKTIGNQMRLNRQQMAIKAEQKAAQEALKTQLARQQAMLEQQQSQAEQQSATATAQNSPDANPVATRQLVLNTLVKMNCTPKVQEGMGITFNYQGGNFVIDAEDGCKFIVVYYPFWYTFRLDDIELLAACQKAVSRANHKYNCTTLYSIYKDENTVALHSKRQLLFIREIPALEQYLPSMLGDFFKSANEVGAEIDKVKELEQA